MFYYIKTTSLQEKFQPLADFQTQNTSQHHRHITFWLDGHLT